MSLAALVPQEGVGLNPSWSGRTREELEREVDENEAGFVRAGWALAELQQRQLYRDAGFVTFEDYCRKRWDFSSRHAYRLIEAAEVVSVLRPIGHTPGPKNEGQARELVPLRDNPEALVDVWAEVVETTPPGAPITAAAVRKVVRAHLSPPPAGDEAAEGGDPLSAFYRADDVVYRQLYSVALQRLAFLTQQTAALERRFRRRARRAIDEDTLAAFGRRLGLAVEQLDSARKMRLVPPAEAADGDADVE